MNVFIMQDSLIKPFGRDVQNALIGFVGENNSRTFFIRTRDDLTSYTVSLVIDETDCGAMTKTPMPDGSTMLTLTLTSGMLGQGGNKICQLIMANDTTVKKSSQFFAFVGLANDITQAATDSATLIVISEAITQMISDSIPPDYSDLLSDIDDIKADLEDLEDRVDALEGGSGGGLTPSIKNALLACFANVAWKDEDSGPDRYQDLEDALFEVTLTGITAVYAQSGTVYSDDSLESLKSDLVVTALYDNGTSQVLTDSAYTLTGNLNSATSTITATFSGKTATFNVSVTLVGSTEYADALSNWFLTATPTATYSDGKITIKGSQSNANSYKLLCFDRAKTLWDTVNGKKLRIRVTMDSPDWVGAVGQQNRVIFGVSIYKNSAITTGNDRQKSQSLDSQILPILTPTTYEFIFDADVSNFDTGDGTPTSASTFGVFIYNVSANTLEITDCSIVEVLS